MSKFSDESGNSPKMKRGRKKGCVLEEVNLRPGGVGKRLKSDSVQWNIDFKIGDASVGSDSECSQSTDGEEEE